VLPSVHSSYWNWGMPRTFETGSTGRDFGWHHLLRMYPPWGYIFVTKRIQSSLRVLGVTFTLWIKVDDIFLRATGVMASGASELNLFAGDSRSLDACVPLFASFLFCQRLEEVLLSCAVTDLLLWLFYSLCKAWSAICIPCTRTSSGSSFWPPSPSANAVPHVHPLTK